MILSAIIVGSFLVGFVLNKIVNDIMLSKIRKEYQKKLDDLEKNVRDYKTNIQTSTKYAPIKIFNDNQRDYVQALAIMAVRPEWLSFMYRMEQNAIDRVKQGSDKDEQLRAIHHIEALDGISVALVRYVDAWNQMSNETEEVVDGEVSLS